MIKTLVFIKTSLGYYLKYLSIMINHKLKLILIHPLNWLTPSKEWVTRNSLITHEAIIYANLQILFDFNNYNPRQN